jgi:hypothetical protein
MMNMRYRIEVTWSVEDQVWVADVPERVTGRALPQPSGSARQA